MRRALLPKHVAAVIKHQKEPLRALQMFNSVKSEDGFTHTFSTYKCMIEKLGFHGEFDAMERMLAEMRMHIDNGWLEGVYIGAMRNYGKKGRVQEAVDLFERMDFYSCQPSVQSYNAIMNILVEFGYFNQAHKVYLRMRDGGIVPDVYTFTIRIKSFCRTSRPHAALRLLNNMPSQGCEHNAVAYCTVIGGFYEADHQAEANCLFDEMLALGICPDVATFNRVLSTVCRKVNVQVGEKLFNKVFKRGVCPNLFTYNIFIQGLCRKGMLDDASILMMSIAREECFGPDVVSYNTLILGLCKNGKVMQAEGYLHKMVNVGIEPDAFTYNTIVDGYCKMGMVQNADKILKDGVLKGFVHDGFTYCSLINGLCQHGDMDRAMDVFLEAKGKGIKPNIVLCNTLVKGLCHHGHILRALQLMDEMLENGCSPDIWTYNLVINGLCKMGCVSEANCLLDDAIAKGHIPDIFTFNTLVNGYCKNHKLDNAFGIIDRMWAHGVTPDVITYNSILNGLCKAAKSEDVMEIFKTMGEKECFPNVVTYNIVIESLCRARKVNEALELFGEMEKKGVSPDVISFGTLIDGFSVNGDLDAAYDLFRRIKNQYRFSHTTAIYNIIINAFSEKLNTCMAKKLFHEMGDQGCPPDSYTYRVMIDGFCKKGDVNSGYDFLVEKIEKGFIPSLTTVGRVINCLCIGHRVHEAVVIVHLMVHKGIVPESVNMILKADKRVVAAPKIVVEELLKKSKITYRAYELLFDGIRDKKLAKKLAKKKIASRCSQNSINRTSGVVKTKSLLERENCAC